MLCYVDVGIPPAARIGSCRPRRACVSTDRIVRTICECAHAGVPVERQKVMAKGVWKGTLKDDADLSSMSFKAGQKVRHQR